MGSVTFRMPDIGEGIHEGEILKWHVQPGAEVQEDQIILEVQNDKAVVELPSPVKGVVTEILVGEGTIATVGQTLAVFEVDGAEGQQAEAELEPFKEKHTDARDNAATGGAADGVNTAQAPLPEKAAGERELRQGAVDGQQSHAAGNDGQSQAADVRGQSQTNGNTEASQASGGRPLATPGVRKLAREKGVRLENVPASGRHGQVTREDVLAYVSGQTASSQEAAKPPVHEASVAAMATSNTAEERVPLKGIRKAIAQAMVKSAYTAPHVTLMDEVEVSALVELRERMKPHAEHKGVKLTYLPFVLKALVAAVRQFPALNASIDDERNEIVYKKVYHIGIATDTEDGLLVPVVQDADRKSMWTIAEQIRDLSARGREGKLSAGELRGSTITITNIGSACCMFFTPVINWPESAILGIGRITEKPVVRGGFIEIGRVMALSLSFDHRIVDGATAQQALNTIKQLLGNPELLTMEV